MDVHPNHTAESLKRVLLTTILLLFVNVIGQAQPTGLHLEESVVAGGPDYFMEVRHVVLKGSNYEIGRKIAEIAKRNNDQIKPSGDPLRNKVQREYMEKNYPIHYERMKGVADTYGLKIENNAYDFCEIDQFAGILGCSAVFYPGGFTQNKHDILSRNYDFTTGNIEGKRTRKNEFAIMSRPYIFEVYPDKGYPSLYIAAFDLLGGALDGINLEGLAVATLADGGSRENPVMGQDEHTIGFHALLSMRYLLDNCKDVTEAKEAMLYLKHYNLVIPCHFTIADKSGQSFVFEFSRLRNTSYLIDGHGIQYITNHLISKYSKAENVSGKDRNIKESIGRLETLRKACRKGGPFSLNDIKSINAKVAIPPYISNDRVYAQGRTLWHSIYDLDERKLSVKFYLGEEPDTEDKTKAVLRYSDYINFQLSTN